MSSTPPFPALPAETLFDIGDLLSARDLSALSRTCRSLHIFLTLPLFRRVRESLSTHLFRVMQSNNNVRLLTYLLDEGLPVDCTMATFQCLWPNRPVATILHFAAASGSDALVRLLIDRGANISAAITRNHEAQVQRAFVNDLEALLNMEGSTPLHCAATHGRDVVAMLLIENGAVVDATAVDGSTPLHCAARARHAVVCKLLISKGADVSAVTTMRRTVLVAAAVGGDAEVARVLIANGADVSAADVFGGDALSYAAMDGHAGVIRLLLANGANVDSANADGQTPLHWAATYGCLSVARLLIEKSANIVATDKYGDLPLSCAIRNQHHAIVRLLRRKSTAPTRRSARLNGGAVQE